MITTDNLRVERGGRAVLGHINLNLARGRLTAVIGPNGAGKSTLLAALAGLIPATVEIEGVAIAALPRRLLSRRRAYLPQNPRVDWPISVRGVVALGLTPTLPLSGKLSVKDSALVDAALQAADLAPLADRPATELSGGELARTMLARATVGNPEILIVDEPTAGLDPRHALDACARLKEQAAGGATVIVALHDIALALAYADDIVALKNGRLVAHCGATEVDEALLSRLYDVTASLEGGNVSFRP